MTDMFACPACGFMNYPGQKFCGQCGELLKYYCPNCDSAVDQTQSSCPGCGALFNWPASEQTEESGIHEEMSAENETELSEAGVDVVETEEERCEAQPEGPEAQQEESAKDLEEKVISRKSRIHAFGTYIGGLIRENRSKFSGSKPVKDEEQEMKAPEVEEVMEDKTPRIVAEVEAQQETEEPLRIEDIVRKIDETQEESIPDHSETRPDSDMVEQIADEPEEIKQDVVEIQEEKEVIVEEEEAQMQSEQIIDTQDDESTYQPKGASQVEGTTCFYHHGREARYVCPKCGQPVCRECYGIRNGEIQCWHCYST